MEGEIQYRKERVYRVKSNFSIGPGYCCGSGFFISDKDFVTCFHVVFGKELRAFKNDPIFMALAGKDVHAKLKTFFKSNINNIEIGTEKGKWVKASLKSFDEKHDVVILEVNKKGKKVNICELDFDPKIDYGNQIFFAGYPTHHSYALDKAPLSVHEGIVSSFILTTIGGESYEHIQINSINLGGNSGAPLFINNSKKVTGIINGNMNMGSDNVLFLDPATNQTIKNSLRIPLSIAYATSFQLLKKKSKYFKTLGNQTI